MSELDSEVLAVEDLIDAQDQDAAFRRFILLRERRGRCAEVRYLQALFDATFNLRPERELIAQVVAIVAEQPGFAEAVALLALLHHRVGNRERANVFAREALKSNSERAKQRARAALGLSPDGAKQRDSGAPGETGSPKGRSGKLRATTDRIGPGGWASASPSAEVDTGNQAAPIPGNPLPRRSTQFYPNAGNDEPQCETPQEAPSPTEAVDRVPPPRATLSVIDRPLNVSPGLPKPVTSSPSEDLDEPRVQAAGNLNFDASNPPALDLLDQRTRRHDSAQHGYAAFSGLADRAASPGQGHAPSFDERSECATQPALNTAYDGRSAADTQGRPSSATSEDAADVRSPHALRSVEASRTLRDAGAELAELTRGVSNDPPDPRDRQSGRVALSRSDSGRILPLDPASAVDRTGIARPHARSDSARFGKDASSSIEALRQWFLHAQTHQLHRPSGEASDRFSTAATLLDLAERVVEGATPLASEPVTLDRRGLVQIEQRIVSLRTSSKSSQVGTERASVTAAASFLLALLLKDCDGRASDTLPEDGACKVVLPAGTTVRPLLIAASFARGRGPGLVETFDRAASATSRRKAPRGPSGPLRVPNGPPASGAVLTVLRRDLDAGTIALVRSRSQPAAAPRQSMHSVAVEFWSTPMGRDVAATSRRVGTFTLADVDALERYAGRLCGPVGFAPPGAHWPWAAPDDIDDAIFAWGAVIGEVLCALYAGRWEADPGNPDDRQLHRVVLSGGVVAWPVANVYLRLARGITHDLSMYVDAVGRVVGRQTLSSAVLP